MIDVTTAIESLKAKAVGDELYLISYLEANADDIESIDADVEEDYECPFCNYEGPMCVSKYEGYYCTRKQGHEGPHVACGSEDYGHELVSWDDSGRVAWYGTRLEDVGEPKI